MKLKIFEILYHHHRFTRPLKKTALPFPRRYHEEKYNTFILFFHPAEFQFLFRGEMQDHLLHGEELS